MSKISEFFGLNCKDESLDFEAAMNTQICPYTQRVCTKMRKSDPDIKIGTCSVQYQHQDVIICPYRLLEHNQIFIDCLHLLTIGLIYRFFTDLDNPNKMDSDPFLSINILDIRENQVRELKKFCKSEFDIDSIFSTASELKYVHEFKNQFAEQVENPSDELTRLFLQGCYTGQKTQAVIEKFRPLLKKALNDYISETMNDKIKNALGGSGGSVSVSEKPTAEPVSTEKDADVSDSNESKIVTTEEELEAYFIIKNLLKDVVDLQDITYKDTESYINILYKKNTRKWICRLKLTDTVKTLIVPDEEKKGQKFNLTSVYDLEQYNDLLHKTLARYM